MQAVSTFQRWGFVLAVSVLLAAAAAAPAAATPAIDWQPCGDDFPGLECATFDVPLDYDQPGGRDDRDRACPRPGGRHGAPNRHACSSIRAVRAAPASGWSWTGSARSADNLGGRFDVVGFDPRGVGASDPMHCFDSEDELDRVPERDAALPVPAPASTGPSTTTGRSLAGRCLRATGAIARHMSTADVVRDLDLLRRAVGDRRLTYLGFSYGCYIGNTYANLFPGKVRALVIDGVLDPRLWSSGWQIQLRPGRDAGGVRRVPAAVRRGRPGCAFGDGRRTAEALGGAGARRRAMSRSTSATASSTPTTS